MRSGKSNSSSQRAARPVGALDAAPQVQRWRMPSARGFTIIELMITLVIAAVLATIGIPAFQHLILSNRLTTAANAMSDAVKLARTDAVKLNATTQFCSNTTGANTGDTLGGACGTDGGAIYGLPQSSSTAGLVRASYTLGSSLQFSGAVTAIRYGGAGFGYNANGGSSSTPYTGRVAKICTSSMKSNNQRIVSMTAGAILATASSTGACP